MKIIMLITYKLNVIDNKKNVKYKTSIDIVDEASLLKVIDIVFKC